MIYVMSDLHGCYDKYKDMLNKLNITNCDCLYILGDVVDRGPDGIKILLDISRRKNVILVKGNHDDIAYHLLHKISFQMDMENGKTLQEAIEYWFLDGGMDTLQQFLYCTNEEKRIILQILKSAPLSQKVNIRGKTFYLSHTIPEKELMRGDGTCDSENYLWGEPDYEEIYFVDKIFVTGHTPTELIDVKYKGRIWKGNNHIAVDCGAVFGNPLGCICLDTMEEFYV